MIDCSEVTATIADPQTDPRLSEQYVRCLSDDGVGTVLLIGVVHDHPASVFRVAHVLRSVTPETLALELPPLATGLFQIYARDRFTPPRLGGEMSAAIQAAGDVRTVGIDAPNRRYTRLLVERLLANPVPRDVLTIVLRDLLYGFAHAMACRIGSFIGSITPLRPRVYTHLEYDASLLDSPSVQAGDEASNLSQHQVFLKAIETPPAIELIDEARDATMGRRLRELRENGDVVAVVGMEHLDALEAEIRGVA
jgi:pheromone shutdown protein TraB